MKTHLTTLFLAFLCGLSVMAQPMARKAPGSHKHHTQRLPGVNERRLARLEKMREANIARRHREGPWRANGQTETKKGLVLLVEFSDKKMQDGAARQWENRFNQASFTLDNHVGSVRDYFIEQSYGQLTIDFDVVGPLKLSKTHDYYGTAPNENLDDRAAEMVIEALRLADPQVNFADYVWGDGDWVDQVYVIYAGRTYYATPGYIWPHEWSLFSAQGYGNGTGYQYMDGVYIDTYAVSNELATDTTLEGIGTACHEFSHCLGYPDFYDTSYLGGTAGQNWDVLDGGSYNGPQRIGEVPSPYTAYERWVAGWVDLIPLKEPYRVKEMPSINEQGEAYIIRNTGNTNEYYILENRQNTTFGSGNLGHGLMVWHIDYNRSAWGGNTVNSDKNHQRMTFLPADGQVGILQGSDRDGYLYDISADDEAGDPYPGMQGINEVQPLTWFTAEQGGTKTHPNQIHHISETADGKINFTYGVYIALPTPEVALPTDIAENTFTANWLPVEGATSYSLEVKGIYEEEDPVTLLEEDFSGFSNIKAGQTIDDMNDYTQVPGWSATAAFGTASACVRIASAKKTGNVTTPDLTGETGVLGIEFDASYYGNDGSSVVVSVLSGSEVVASESVAVTAERATYTLTFHDVPSICKVMFASTAENKRFFLYNVKIIDREFRDNKPIVYEGITATSYTVTPIDADAYCYRVKAEGDEGPSEWSEWMSVDIASPVDESLAKQAQKPLIYDLYGRRLSRFPRHSCYLQNGKVHLSR